MRKKNPHELISAEKVFRDIDRVAIQIGDSESIFCGSSSLTTPFFLLPS